VETYISEETLITGLRQGEARAYEYLYRDVRQLIVHLVEFNRGTAEDATDLLQEAMVVLFHNLQKPEFVLTCKVKTYLYSVCRNKWFYYLKKKKLDYFDIADYIDLPEELPDTDSWTQDQQLKEVINNLDDICRKLLLYFYFDGLSLKEIALQLDLKNANVAKARRFRCMERLKEKAKNILDR
jgi:RNA polymerase sigma factor (sigma-70 family)